jgi:hypothetical protein
MGLMQHKRGRPSIDFRKSTGLGRDRLFDYCVGTHHEVLAPERNREHSIQHQIAALNVGVHGAVTDNPALRIT